MAKQRVSGKKVYDLETPSEEKFRSTEVGYPWTLDCVVVDACDQITKRAHSGYCETSYCNIMFSSFD